MCYIIPTGEHSLRTTIMSQCILANTNLRTVSPAVHHQARQEAAVSDREADEAVVDIVAMTGKSMVLQG